MTNTPPTHFNGGAPTVDDLLSIGGVSITVYNGGLGYGADGRIPVDPSTVNVVNGYVPGGLPLFNGFLAVDESNAITHWNAGLPYTALNRLAIGALEAPSLLGGFDEGFDAGFG